MGRLGVDVYPLQVGVSLRRVRTFGKYLGGSAANVAVAAARYGRRAALVSRTGDDPFGGFLHDELRRFGVDDSLVTTVADLPTPVTFCEIFPPDHFPLYFYRRPSAPDLQIDAKELDLDVIAGARVLWVTGTGLCAEPSRTATLGAMRQRTGAGTTIIDLDYRPDFWSSRVEARRWMQEALGHADVAVGNLDECLTAVGTDDAEEAANALLACGPRLAVVKLGAAGVLARERGGASVRVPALATEVVNGLGAGDAFGGALSHGLLAGWELEPLMRFGNAAGAIVASRLACGEAMPDAVEVEATLSARSRR